MRTRKLLIQVLLYGVLGLALVATLTPLVWLVAAAFKNADDFFHYLFFPPPRNLSLENFRRLFGSPALVTGEIRNWPALCRKLEQAGTSDAASPAGRLWRAIEAPARSRMAEVARSGTTDPHDQQFLLDALNKALAQTDIFQAADLSGLPLDAETRALADRGPANLPPHEAMRFNRNVLDLAMPDEVAKALKGIPFGRYMMNSLLVAGASVLVQMFLSSLGGFALAKYEFRGKRLMMTVMLASMMIPSQVMLAPLYELIYRFGFMDSFLGLIVPGMVSVFGMFLFRQSMLQIPDELLEAGRMDGCTEFGLYWHVALPVSRPMIGAFSLVAFMGNWNAFLWPQIILHTSDLFTIPIGLNQMVGTYSQQYGVMMAGTLLAIAPVMVLFVILQREFISGLTLGAVKG